ncbi:hypothetical protein PCANC_02256 [Puccinia coronata f. sp. avenae]|uniref:alpha-1,2-Mannosidase n=1 Tax=Puccinia coronata f. sp. avenae TaxID=200324 RepID=A0A2N5W0N9_9BASI|nr:hypothetical protein PCANC_02256 [Puccinia coronata f. sp. avenae]
MTAWRARGTIPAWGALTRSRVRAILSLALASGCSLYLYFYFHSPILHNTPRLPAEKFEVAPNYVAEPVRAKAASLSETSAVVAGNETLNQPTVLISNRTYTPDELMRLPILHRTFEDALDPRNGFKPLRDSKSPWLASTPTGALLIEQLSRNRFPPPGSIDSSRGSTPPPIPRWPPRSSLRKKNSALQNPIPKEMIAGLNTSYVWEDRHRIPDGKLPKVQWAGFDKPNWETHSDRTNRLERQGWVRRGFQHVWEGYKAKAWGHDELRPVSGSFEDGYSGWGATLVDSLDTLLIMNLTREYNYARTHVKAIDWSYTVKNHLNSDAEDGPKISFFETVIRYLGGLISAYDLSGDNLMLQRAEDLAEWLLPAFGTSSGFPMTHYQLGTNPLGIKVGRVVTADIGSLTLEFTRLSQITSKDYYYDMVQKITDVLDGDQWVSPDRLGTLFPIFINPEKPQSLSDKYSMGAMVDSYYEYLIKEHQLLRGTKSQYSKMYTSVIESARTHLMKTYNLEYPGGKNFTVLGNVEWGVFTPAVDHLICFSGAMIGLGAKILNRKEDLDLAMRHADTCVRAYESTETGFMSKARLRQLKSHVVRGPSIANSLYKGRPETIESVYYMWRITGDRQWQDRGWRMFTSWMESCVTKYGFANLENVNYWPPLLVDKQESFVLAETFKYYYLLFSEPDLISLDEYVFNTEAHPFRLDIPGKPVRRFWTKPDESLNNIYDPPGVSPSERGYGTFLQQWERANLTQVSETDRQTYSIVTGTKYKATKTKTTHARKQTVNLMSSHQTCSSSQSTY